MNAGWLAAPVSVFFRRVFNVLSSLSLAHQAAVHSHLFATPDSYPASSSPSPPNPPPNPPSPPRHHHRRRRSNDDALPADTTPVDSSILHTLMRSPVLYDPVRTPRYPIVLCHGLYGFDVRGPSSLPLLRTHYWADVRSVLRRIVNADVLVAAVPATGAIAHRARALDAFLRATAHGRGVNLLAHSMGGLDGRYLISSVRPEAYVPLSLTTIATPHRGSPFMDWCADHLGLGHSSSPSPSSSSSQSTTNTNTNTNTHHHPHGPNPSADTPASAAARLTLTSLPSSLTALLLALLDSPAYANLTTAYLRDVFNPATPDDPRVRYWSVGARARSLPVWHPLWFPKLVVDAAEERTDADADGTLDGTLVGNDGLVSLHSARWGTYLGTLDGTDHWRVRGESGSELGAHVAKEWARVARVLGRSSVGDASGGGGDAGANGEVKRDGEDGGKARDEAIRSSTARLSAVVDWLVEQVPAVASSSSSSTRDDAKAASGAVAAVMARKAKAAEKGRDGGEKDAAKKERRDLATDADLERFYVALAKNMWDAGL